MPAMSRSMLLRKVSPSLYLQQAFIIPFVTASSLPVMSAIRCRKTAYIPSSSWFLMREKYLPDFFISSE